MQPAGSVAIAAGGRTPSSQLPLPPRAPSPQLPHALLPSAAPPGTSPLVPPNVQPPNVQLAGDGGTLVAAAATTAAGVEVDWTALLW